MTYDATNHDHIAEAAKDSRLAERQRGEIIATIMDLGPGRRWIHDLLTSCHVFASSFTSDGLSMAFNEGERNVGLKLLADIMSAAPDSFTLMMREANERDRTNDTRRDRTAKPPGYAAEPAHYTVDARAREGGPINDTE